MDRRDKGPTSLIDPAGGARNAVVQVDVPGLQSAGYEIPEESQVTGAFGMPGEGTEMQFGYRISSQFLKRIQ
jgi:hypothetical protein